MRHHGESSPPTSPGAPVRTHSDWATLGRLLPYLWQYKWRVLAALAFMVGAKLANVGVPLLLKKLVDAMAVDLPMLDRRHSDFAAGEAPAAMDALADRIAAADGFVFVTGEYNGGLQPGLKNLVDHYLPQFAWRPAAIAS